MAAAALYLASAVVREFAGLAFVVSHDPSQQSLLVSLCLV